MVVVARPGAIVRPVAIVRVYFDTLSPGLSACGGDKLWHALPSARSRPVLARPRFPRDLSRTRYARAGATPLQRAAAARANRIGRSLAQRAVRRGAATGLAGRALLPARRRRPTGRWPLAVRRPG